MNYLNTLIACLLLLAVQGVARAQIYETTDAEGNPVFTDAPVDATSSAVALPETNISDAPPPAPEESGPSAPDAGPKDSPTPKPTETFRDPNADLWEERVRREGEMKRRESSTPYEVLDGETPHETMGGEAPHQTMGGEAPHETMGGEAPHETMGGEAPHETMGGEAPREVGDF